MSYTVYKNPVIVFDDEVRVEVDSESTKLTFADSWGDVILDLRDDEARALAKFLYEELGL